ncbi:MAG: hypothetical protein RBT50_10310 [Bacteroidales bacterium]|jgi:hypothetical protein|nr:hypothetical protein [Bacteroidales bacterium]
MRRILILPAVLLVSLACFSQPKPGKPAFIVNYEESGRYGDESWSYSGVVKFSLSNWSEPLRGKGYTPEQRKMPLEFDPGAFLKLQPGAVVKFYPSEIDEAGSGTNGSYTRFLGTDGVETTVEITDQGTRTKVTDDATFRKGNNIPYNENFLQNARYYQLGNLAELERTATGGILRAYTAIGNNLSQWAVSMETEEQVFPEVYIFVLTDAEIRSWKQISKTSSRNGSSEDDNLSVTVAVKMDVPDLVKPEVTLYGCSELGAGEQKDIMASGKPEGGEFRFWVEPGNLLNVQPDGESSAILTGATPGKGTLYVEYTASDGQTTQATQQAAYLKVDSYNGGEELPQIALYNIEGKKTNGVLTVPVEMEPAASAELLRFEVASPDILSATGVADKVHLQGIRTGKTTVQAKTSCGKLVGPAVDAEVVYCDDETKAKLAEEARIASEIIKEQLKELEDILNSEEYKKASGRILESSANLALKTSGLIFGMAAGVPGVDQAVKATGDVFGAGSAVLDLVRSGNLSEAGMNTIKLGVELFGEAVMGVISGAEETYQAAKDFGEDLGVVEGATYRMSNAQQWIEHWTRYIDDLIRRQKLCESGTGQDGGQGEPSQEPVQKPAEPGSGTANEPTDGAGAAKSGGEQPSAEEPASGEAAGEKIPGEGAPGGEPGGEKVPGEGGEISPPPPTTATGQAGLPYAPGECGCNSTKTMKPGSEAIATLHADTQNLNKCVGNFQNGPLNGYIKTLREWKAVTDGLETALGKDKKIAESAMLEAIPRMESLLQQTQSFDIAGQEFIKDFEKCPASSSSWMDILKSAVTVTVDSIKTKY